jgi:hypothetical protein
LDLLSKTADLCQFASLAQHFSLGFSATGVFGVANLGILRQNEGLLTISIPFPKV